jgi:hypothetical protein
MYVAFSAEVHPIVMASAMKRAVLICMLVAKVCEGNTRRTNTTHKGGRGVSGAERRGAARGGAGRHKAAGGILTHNSICFL